MWFSVAIGYWLLLLQVKVVLPEREREVLENITWMLDKQENDTLPQVSLNTLEVSGCGLGSARGDCQSE